MWPLPHCWRDCMHSGSFCVLLASIYAGHVLVMWPLSHTRRDCLHSGSIWVPLASMQVTCMSCDQCGTQQIKFMSTLDSSDFLSVVAELHTFWVNLCPTCIYARHVNVLWQLQHHCCTCGIACILGQFSSYLQLCGSRECPVAMAASMLHLWDRMHSGSMCVLLAIMRVLWMVCDNWSITVAFVGLHAFWVNLCPTYIYAGHVNVMWPLRHHWWRDCMHSGSICVLLASMHVMWPSQHATTIYLSVIRCLFIRFVWLSFIALISSDHLSFTCTKQKETPVILSNVLIDYYNMKIVKLV